MITLKKHWDTEDGAEPVYEQKSVTLETAKEEILQLLQKTGSEQECLEKSPREIRFVRMVTKHDRSVVCHHITTFTGQAGDLKQLQELIPKA